MPIWNKTYLISYYGCMNVMEQSNYIKTVFWNLAFSLLYSVLTLLKRVGTLTDKVV
jgi:hypothetical protein